MKRFVPITLTLALACGAPALAGLDAKNGEIGLDFGYVRFDSNVSDTAGGRFNFRGGYCFTKLFELEGQGAGLASVDTGVVDVKTGLVIDLVNAVFNFHPANRQVVHYVLAGIGSATLTIVNSTAR